MLTPGFAADCLETLEEIGVENAGYFKAGATVRPVRRAARAALALTLREVHDRPGRWL